MSGTNGRTVDIHAHVVTPACLELVKGLMEPEYEPFSFWAGKETNEYQAGHMQEIIPKATDPAVRIADMDAMGIDVQAISVAPAGYFYWADPELGRLIPVLYPGVTVPPAPRNDLVAIFAAITVVVGMQVVGVLLARNEGRRAVWTAPIKALETVLENAGASLPSALETEARAFAALAVTPLRAQEYTAGIPLDWPLLGRSPVTEAPVSAVMTASMPAATRRTAMACAVLPAPSSP